jgi:hypothetical protein
MNKSAIDQLIATLGETIVTNGESFESLAKQHANDISVDDLPYLVSKLHNPPPEPASLDQQQFRLGEWLAICQYAIFELIYQLDIKAIDTLRSIAFGEYDWTQATALEVLCRLYLDGKLPADIISEIDNRLAGMRHETHLYFAQGLAARRKRDQRFNGLIKQIKNVDLHLAFAELGQIEPMTREELIELGKKIIDPGTSEEENSKLMELFDANVPHPEGSSLFFYPENFNADTDNISEYNPAAEEVVDKCLNYKPIIL